MSEWQPIETFAVQDMMMKAFLFWCPRSRCSFTGYYNHYFDEGERFRSFGGSGALDETPTHWMPLPEPPK